MAISRRRSRAFVAAALLTWSLGTAAVFGRGGGPFLAWKPSLGLEYLSRTIVWDEETRSSKLGASFALAGLEVQVFKSLTVSALAGYSFINWNGLVFRGLPFSIDYEAGSSGGFMAGGGIDAVVFTAGFWELGATGRFLASLGSTKKLTISGLNEPGALEGRGTWMRLEAGPVVAYKGFEGFSPFLGGQFDRLWGAFTLDETVKELSGSEEKKIKGKGSFAVIGGTRWEPGPSFGLNFQVSLLPAKKVGGGVSLDLGASLKAVVSF